MQRQEAQQATPAWKHSQYFFWQFERWQLHPRECDSPFPVTAALNLGRNAVLLRESLCFIAFRRASVCSGLQVFSQSLHLHPAPHSTLAAKHSQ